MKKLLMILVLIFLPLSVNAAEVEIVDPYSKQLVSAEISTNSYNLMINWNQQAPKLAYPLVKAVAFKGTVGFEIIGKAYYYPLYNHNTNKIDRIDLYRGGTTTDTEVANYIHLLKKHTSPETQFNIISRAK